MRMKVTKANVDLSMGRTSGSDGHDTFMIRITDRTSNAEIVHVELELGDALGAITGRVLSDVPAELGELELVGRQHSVEQVEIPRGNSRTVPQTRRLIDAEVAKLSERLGDGYLLRPRYEDATNGHRGTPHGTQAITVHCWKPRANPGTVST